MINDKYIRKIFLTILLISIYFFVLRPIRGELLNIQLKYIVPEQLPKGIELFIQNKVSLTIEVDNEYATKFKIPFDQFYLLGSLGVTMLVGFDIKYLVYINSLNLLSVAILISLLYAAFNYHNYIFFYNRYFIKVYYSSNISFNSIIWFVRKKNKARK